MAHRLPILELPAVARRIADRLEEGDILHVLGRVGADDHRHLGEVPDDRSHVREEEPPVTVEDAQTPGREYQKTRAGKQHPGDGNRQVALLTTKARCDERDEKRCCDNTCKHERRGEQREQRSNSAGDPGRLLAFASCDERGSGSGG